MRLQRDSKIILEFLKSLPKGKVTTYKALAEKFNMHPRAVARILASNKQLDEYPCYKVVHANGAMGGYAAGVKEKIKRLNEEGVVVKNGRISKEFIITKL